MGTEFSSIFDLFMVQIKDWRLQSLYESSVLDFEVYLSGFLFLSIPQFDEICNQSLVFNKETKTFTETLTNSNQVILAKLMVEKWLEKEVQDVNQMNLHLQDRDFKVYSESQNLQAKSLHLDKTKEYNSQIITNYSYSKSTDWAKWYTGSFYVPQ
jgi:hypothetical protein